MIVIEALLHIYDMKDIGLVSKQSQVAGILCNGDSKTKLMLKQFVNQRMSL